MCATLRVQFCLCVVQDIPHLFFFFACLSILHLTNPFSVKFTYHCLQCAIFFSIVSNFQHSSLLLLKALLQFKFPRAVQLPKEGNSIITSDTRPCLGVYSNAINTFAEKHHAAALQIILYHFSCSRLLLWHICCLYYYTRLKKIGALNGDCVEWMTYDDLGNNMPFKECDKLLWLNV